MENIAWFIYEVFSFESQKFQRLFDMLYLDGCDIEKAML